MAQGTFVQALRKEAALSSTFMKGRSLMLNGAVLSFEDSGSRFSKNVNIEGTVRGSRGDLYKTQCARHGRARGYRLRLRLSRRLPLFRHVQARHRHGASVSGCQRRRARRGFAHAGPHVYGTARTVQAARPSRAHRICGQSQLSLPGARPHEPKLVAALSDLSDARMDELVAMRCKLAGTIDPDAPKAVLEPSLVPYYNPLFADRFNWALEFRIRCGSVSYVVKDIDGMADAYVRGGTFSYGKKLTFVHVPEAFDDVSTKLLDFVAMTVAYLSDITSSRSASYDFARSGFVAERQLPVSEHSIVSVLDLLRGRTMSFEPAWSRGTTTHRSYEVEVEPSPQGEGESRLSARRSLPPRLYRRREAAMTCAFRPIRIALSRATRPIWSIRAARAVPTRRLPSMRRRSYRTCCPAAHRFISPPTRWASSAAWRCLSCATIPT